VLNYIIKVDNMSPVSQSKIPPAELSNGHTIPLVQTILSLLQANNRNYSSVARLRNRHSIVQYKHSSFDEIDRPIVDAIKRAIKLGFNHIDCAELYNTEPEVGVAIKESGIPRQDFFITTIKVINNIKSIPAALDASLKKLQVDYVDLYLILLELQLRGP
jgi:hypothetical protein